MTDPPADPAARHVVVVGGGISGLAAAHALRHRGLRVTVLEASARVGGKLRVSELAGVPVDEGAEALLLRRPEAVALARAAGLGDDLEDAATTSASVWSRGRLRPLPGGTVMGIPGDLRALAATGVLTGRELARVPLDAWLPKRAGDGDVAVGRLVSGRMGRAVVDRLVEPLLGGVYAGRADDLSVEATLPQLAPHLRGQRSLLAAVRAARADTADRAPDAALFGALRRGVGRLADEVARRSGAEIRTGATVRELARTPDCWRLVTGPTNLAEEVLADGVVLAVPAAPAARLLRPHAAAAASDLGQVRYASVAVVALAFTRGAVPTLPDGSGFLVPPVEGRAVKGVTISSAKWGWYADAAPGLVLLRASVGRAGEENLLHRDDTELVDVVLADLADLIGVLAPPVDVRVTRWGGGLPQYAVGHRDRVARIRTAVAALPALAVAGAAYDGVGVPTCVASGQQAAADLLRQWGHGEQAQGA